MDQRERMLAGLPYKAWLDGLPQQRLEAKRKLYVFNNAHPEDQEASMALLRDLLGQAGDNLWVEPIFRCDYGSNISVGDNFYANYNLTILDIAPVTIGNNVMIAPNVSIFTAGHPIHPQARNSGYEYGRPITIGNNVWIGGGAILLPGVTIGDNAVIAAGSVVGRDVPAGVVAAGNPCRVVREITDADRDFYWRNFPFDVEDYLDPNTTL